MKIFINIAAFFCFLSSTAFSQEINFETPKALQGVLLSSLDTHRSFSLTGVENPDCELDSNSGRMLFWQCKLSDAKITIDGKDFKLTRLNVFLYKARSEEDSDSYEYFYSGKVKKKINGIEVNVDLVLRIADFLNGEVLRGEMVQRPMDYKESIFAKYAP